MTRFQAMRRRYTDEQKIALALALIEMRKRGKFHAVYVDRDIPAVQHALNGPRYGVTWETVAKLALAMEHKR